MTKEFTYSEIFNAIQGLDSGLGSDGAPAVFRLRAVRNIKNLRNYKKDFDDEQKKLMKEYAELDERDNPKTEKVEDDDGNETQRVVWLEDDSEQEYKNAVNELAQTTVEVDGLKTVGLSQLENWSMPAITSFHADFMFEDDLD